MPLSVRVGVTVILLALAATLAVTVVRARAGRLRRSGLSGVRTPSALVDDAAFERANRAATPILLVAAVWATVVAIAVAVTGLDAIGGSAILIVAGILLGALLLLGGLRGERAARRGLTAPAGTPGARSRSGSGGGRSSGGRSGRRSRAGSKASASGSGSGSKATGSKATGSKATGSKATGSRATGSRSGTAGAGPKVSGRDGGPRRPSR